MRAQGVGRATATVIWDRGALVAISDINVADCKETKKLLLKREHEVRQRVSVCEVDVGKADVVNTWIEEVVDVFGHLDHGASIAEDGDRTAPMSDRSDSEFGFELISICGALSTVYEHS